MTTEFTAGELRDHDGFAPVAAYAVIGDGRSTALICADGAIDWWGVPRIDSPPLFSGLLDPMAGGSARLAPTDPASVVTRRYLPHTNQLETTFTTERGQVRVTDSLNGGNAGPLPWTELARRVEGVEGEVEMTLEVAPGTGLGLWQPWAEQVEDAPVLRAGDLTVAVRCSRESRFTVERARVSNRFTVARGESVVTALLVTESEPLYLADTAAIETRIALTAESWRQWSAQVQWHGPGREQIVRSALALKLLMLRNGAVAAAATTSLPERIGGDKNWDYRFCWVRDAALTIGAMARCGLQEEVHSATAWLLRTIRKHGPDAQVLYALDGSTPTDMVEPEVPGYRNSVPVRVGNDASGQIQLGIYGDLFQTVSDWVFDGHVLDTATARELADLADRCADRWHHPDAGIWELHTNRHYTSSKMNCWRALVCAANLADAGHIAGPAGRWQREADAIRAWIEQHCWSSRYNSYTFYAGTDDLDASVLLGAQFGYDTGTRMSSTIDALRSHLSAGPLLYRYSNVDKEEQTFIACAYWLVDALARVGRVEEAEQLMNQLDGVTNDVGLLSEMATPPHGELVGNMPQALSHLAYINAAFTLRRAQPSREEQA